MLEYIRYFLLFLFSTMSILMLPISHLALTWLLSRPDVQLLSLSYWEFPLPLPCVVSLVSMIPYTFLFIPLFCEHILHCFSENSQCRCGQHTVGKLPMIPTSWYSCLCVISLWLQARLVHYYIWLKHQSCSSVSLSLLTWWSKRPCWGSPHGKWQGTMSSL